MAVVSDHMSGNCHIIVKDDYVVKTKEEEQQILDNIARIYVKYKIKSLEDAAAKKKEA